MEELSYQNYVKIQDTLLQLARGCVVTFNLSLYSYSDKYQKKMYYYSEVAYHHPKMKENVVNIKRKFEPYLAIEQTIPNADVKNFIMIRQDDIMGFRMFLNTVYKEIYEQFQNIFYIRNGQVSTKTDKNLPVYTFNDLPLNGSITFVPTTLDTYGQQSIGVLMFLGDKDHPMELTMPRFSALVETISNIDLMLYAQNAMSYVGRPPFGTNSYDPNNLIEQNTKPARGRFNRSIPGPKNEFDFFD